MDIRIIAGILLLCAYLLERANRFVSDFSGDWLNPYSSAPNVPDSTKEDVNV